MVGCRRVVTTWTTVGVSERFSWERVELQKETFYLTVSRSKSVGVRTTKYPFNG